MRDKAMQDRNELDILLDAALATYANPEPSPGLTPRILAATRAIDRHPPVRWMALAVPALAAALQRVLHDEDLRLRIAREAASRAVLENADHTAERFEALYRDVLR